MYLLRLTATDGELSDSASITVNVKPYLEYAFAYPSPQEVAFSPDSALVAVADMGLNRVALMNCATRQLVRSIPVEGSPRGMAWISASNLWVCEYDAGSLAKLDATRGTVLQRATVGLTPYDLKRDTRRHRLVASDFGQNQLWILDEVTGQTITNLPVGAQPMYLALTADQQVALVGNSEPTGDARAVDHAASVSFVDLDTFATSEVRLPPGSTSLRGIAVSPDGRWAYVAHLLGRTYLPTTQLNNGWVLNNVVSILDLTARQVYATVPLDALEQGAANPWGLAVSTNGATLWVCGSGVHELLKLDLASLHNYLATNAQARAGLDSDLITLYQSGWLQRRGSVGSGPRGIALAPDGHTLALAAYFSGQVRLLDTLSNQVNNAVATGPAVPEHALRRGERLYYDGDGCYQRWLSCASCHPHNRADGLNWDLVNDGVGNVKNTLSHVYSTATPPSMSTGVRASTAVAIQAGFKFIQFQQRSDQEMQDVYDFMTSLRPEPSPYWNKNWLSVSAVRGKALFESPAVGCANCHSGPYFTDQRRYNVGTGHPGDVGPLDPIYDTPTLHELWRTPPYLHDGSAPTLRDVLTTHNSNNLHGATSQLNSAQLDDLVAYLQQVGGSADWVNYPPLVVAGPDQLLTLPAATAQLSASAQDDGLPAGSINLAWSVQAGPGPVAFGDTTQPATTAAFTLPGEYTLQCVASDGDLAATNTLLVTVRPPGSLADSDSDGMADQWEIHYFSSLLAANGGPDDDWDHDGLSNLYEYLTGSDPTDPNSGFHLKITSESGQVVVRFPAYAAGTPLTPGHRYFTLRSSVPDGGQILWTDVPGYADILGANQTVEYTAPLPQPIQLFRVHIRLDP